MQKTTLLTGLSLCVALSLQAQVWENKTPLPTNEARNHPVTWGIGNYGYVLTGETAAEGTTRDFFKYDPATDNWEQLDDFPGAARSYSIGAMYEGKGYIGFGSTTGAYLNDLWRYDPDTEVWEELTPCPCDGRQHPTLTINEAQGKLYMGKGNNQNGNLKDWWEYDIATDTWTVKPDFPGTNRHHPFHFSIGAYSYTGLGHDNSPEMAKSDWYRYDPATDTWDQMTSAPGGRIAGTQFAYDGYGYVLSGDGEGHQHTDPSIFWRYDPVTDTWKELIPHPGASLWAPGSFIIDGILYFFGGVDFSVGSGQFFEGMWATDLNNIVVDIDELAEETKLQLYPNPVTDYLHITTTAQASNASIGIYSIDGRRLQERPFQKTVNVSALAPGVYLLKLSNKSGGTVQVMRFTKQ